jgi:glycosyltransferase involved in cell wall biosynthesis
MGQSVVYVGMDLHPPYNEICAKIVKSLVSNLPEDWNYTVLSIPNPGCKMSPSPNNHYVSLPRVGVWISAILLPLYIIRYARLGNLVHFLMPARHYNYIALIFRLCKFFNIPTIYTLLKNNDEQIFCGRMADVVVAQTRAAYERCTILLEGYSQSDLIYAGSAESIDSSVTRKKKEILFVGVPWKKSDLKRRGVLLFFEVIKQVLLKDTEVHFTLLNRALTNAPLLDDLAQDIPKENLSIIHETVFSINRYFSLSSVFLILHLDELCPDPPLSAIEAIACGCPVITTKYNSLAEEIASSMAGIRVESDSDSIAQGILQVLAKVETYSKNALKLGSEYFDEMQFCKSYYKIYKGLDRKVNH